MTSTVPKFDRVEEVGAYLRELPFVREQEAQRRAELDAERRQIASELTKGELRYQRECAVSQKHVDGLEAEVRGAERELAERRARLATAQVDAGQVSCSWEMQRARFEKRMRDTADPTIGEFISWCWSTFFEERVKDRVIELPGKMNTITGTRGPARMSGNTKSLTSRLAGLRAAAAAAEALRYEIGIDVAARLAEIKAAIPKFDSQVVIELDSPAHASAVAEAEDMAALEATRRRRQGLMGP